VGRHRRDAQADAGTVHERVKQLEVNDVVRLPRIPHLAPTYAHFTHALRLRHAHTLLLRPGMKTTYALLTPAEILLADDKELNEYVCLTKLVPWHRERRDTWDDAKRAEHRAGLKGSPLSEREKLVSMST